MIIQNIVKRFIGKKKYNNVIEASYSSFLIRKMLGTSVMVTTLQPGNIVGRRFCPIGFLLFVIWNSIYLFCTYKVFNDDQTIVKRLLSHTKLRRYGDDYERISSFIFVLFAMAVTPFKLSGNKVLMQKVFDVDKVLKDSGETIDYNKIPIRSLTFSIGQALVYFTGLLCHWFFLNSIGTSVSEKIFINMYTDTQGFVISFTFVNYILLLRSRFELIKQALIRIREENNRKCNVFHRIEVPKDLTKVSQLSDKQICEKIRYYAKIYTMLCKISYLFMKIIGLPVHVCFFMYKAFMILYIFYLMEAAQLSFDMMRFMEFIFLCLWGLIICICIIFSVIYFSETTMKEVVHIRYVVHDIINANISPSVNKEAMQFSMQLLHEKPVFSVLGMYKLNYELIFEGAKTITTYLVILLQFVTGRNLEI